MQVIVSMIAATTIRQGLKIRRQPEHNTYELGKKISDEELAKVNLNREDFYGERPQDIQLCAVRYGRQGLYWWKPVLTIDILHGGQKK